MADQVSGIGGRGPFGSHLQPVIAHRESDVPLGDVEVLLGQAPQKQGRVVLEQAQRQVFDGLGEVVFAQPVDGALGGGLGVGVQTDPVAGDVTRFQRVGDGGIGGIDRRKCRTVLRQTRFVIPRHYGIERR
ncbi:hypothetical protein [Mycolicibacterium fluoranthenivorans]|uniref:hypothetical protein n=1 Tax=Mycolicibacterium fluoranthenivorans TaxID=258505 RepID=UPI001424069B|nr:hypothetical protein [Mycolicibacterium fluoranthenivorans]MCV7359873.1 hypothetical protein [Mycolicibacterium fluoranthenivorans]